MLVAAALAHCATLSASKEQLPSTTVSLRAYYFDPCFFWAPPAARAAVFAWARSANIAQLSANIQPFGVLPDDCAGDVMEFFGMTHKETELLEKHCSSLAAQDWVRAVVAAAVVVGALKCFHNIGPQVFLLLYPSRSRYVLHSESFTCHSDKGDGCDGASS